MELLNLQFAILLIKVTLCAIPGVVGLAFIFNSTEGKRAWRDTICRVMFGFPKAVSFQKFARFLMICGLLLLSFSAIASWFLLLKDLFES